MSICADVTQTLSVVICNPSVRFTVGYLQLFHPILCNYLLLSHLGSWVSCFSLLFKPSRSHLFSCFFHLVCYIFLLSLLIKILVYFSTPE